MLENNYFNFRQFKINHTKSAFKVGFDGVFLGAICNVIGASQILDVGAGCGLLSLMIAQRNSLALITALEPDKNSFLECKENFVNSKWHVRLNCQDIKFQDFQNTDDKFDLIVSNPPYYNSLNFPKTDIKKYSKHTESLNHKELLTMSFEMLNITGILSVILPYNEYIKLSQTAEFKRYNLHRMINVMSKDKITRVVFELTKANVLKTEILDFNIYDYFGNYCKEYLELTDDFYLRK